jgi:hypothetical protein
MQRLMSRTERIQDAQRIDTSERRGVDTDKIDSMDRLQYEGIVHA